jgi:hypothetical protein
MFMLGYVKKSIVYILSKFKRSNASAKISTGLYLGHNPRKTNNIRHSKGDHSLDVLYELSVVAARAERRPHLPTLISERMAAASARLVSRTHVSTLMKHFRQA